MSKLRLLLAPLWLAGCSGDLRGGSDPGGDGWTVITDAGGSDARTSDAPRPELGQLAPDAGSPVPDSKLKLDSKPVPDSKPASKRIGLGKIVGGSYTVSQPYGPTTFWMDYSYCKAYGTWPAGQNVHCGIDLAIPRGTPLYAGEAGTVITAGGTAYFKDDLNAAAGELKLQFADGTHVIYGHTSKVEVQKGAKVTVGQRIGLSGTAGTGAHLHLEVRVPDSSLASGFRTVDPMTFFGP